MSEQSCWDILHIEPTADEAVIKRAYAKQLKLNKPDKNPEGFRQVRQAYEDALQQRYWYDYDYDDDETDEFEDKSDIDASVIDVSTIEASDVSDKTTGETLLNPQIASPVIKLPESLDKTFDVKKDIDKDSLLNPSDENPLANDPPDLDVLAIAQTNIANPSTNNADADFYSNTTFDDKLSIPFGDRFDSTLATDFDAEINAELDIADCETAWSQFSPINDDETDDTDENNYGVMRYQPSQDDGLQQLLIDQAQQLHDQPLDTQYDFECALLAWLYYQPRVFPHSFAWAVARFGWQARATGWDSNQYPWYFLDDLQQDYQRFVDHKAIIRERQAFWDYLNFNAPPVFHFLPSDLEEKVKFNRWYFLRHLSIPVYGYPIYDTYQAIAPTFKDIEQYASPRELGEWQSTSHFAKLQNLGRWFEQPFFRLSDALLVGLVIAGAMLGLFLLHGNPWQSYVLDGMTTWLMVGVLLGFWQVCLWLFSQPERLLVPERLASRQQKFLYVIAPVYAVLASVYAFVMPDAGVASDIVYYLAHLYGLALFGALISRRYDESLHPLFIYRKLHQALVLLFLAVVMPSLYLLTKFVYQDTLIEAKNIVHLSPLFWLILVLPIVFVTLINRGERWQGLSPLLALLQNIARWLMYPAYWLLLASCLGDLFSLRYEMLGITTFLGFLFIIYASVNISAFYETE